MRQRGPCCHLGVHGRSRGGGGLGGLCGTGTLGGGLSMGLLSDGLGGASGGVRLLKVVLSRAQLLLKPAEGRLVSCLELASLLSAPTRLHIHLSTQLRLSSLESLDSLRGGFE